MKRLKWLVLVAIGMYYCATPVPYERASIPQGFYGIYGISGTAVSGKIVTSTSCGQQSVTTESRYVGAFSALGAELGYGKATRGGGFGMALGVNLGLGGGGLVVQDGGSGVVPVLGGSAFLRLGTRLGNQALAYQLGLGAPPVTQALLLGFGRPERVTLALRQAIFGSDQGQLSQELSLWATVHRDKTSISFGVGHASEASGDSYTFISGGIGWRWK